jgi:mannose-6-phosphate isomerase
VVLAEVQQSSDATFRLWDWDRVGVEGKPRPLHRQEALASIDWTVGPVNPVQPVEPRSTPEIPRGVRGEGLVACRYFFLNRFHLGQAMEVPFPKQLSIWMLLEGEAQLSCESGYTRRLRQGETVLGPTAMQSCSAWSCRSQGIRDWGLGITAEARRRGEEMQNAKCKMKKDKGWPRCVRCFCSAFLLFWQLATAN